MCRLGSSLTVPGKRRSSSSSREGQRVITYSLEFESLRRQLEIQRPADMVSSSLERDGPGVRLMSAPGSERCPRAGVMSRSSSHCRNSLGLLSRSQLEVRLSTASSDKDAQAVMSQMVSRVSPGTTVPTRDLLSLSQWRQLLPVLHHLMLDLDLYATRVLSLFPDHPIQYLLLWVLRSGRGRDVM